METKLRLSTVLPAHNEEENIATTVGDCVEYMEKSCDKYEVIVVNDGSGDNTKSVVEGLIQSNKNIVLVNHEVNQGYGSALRSGFDAARLDYIFFMDSDGQFDVTDIDRLKPYIDSKNVVIGYRENRADSFIRLLNAWMYQQYINVMFGLSVRDIDCAFKIFPNAAYKVIKPIKAGGALFSAEFLIKLKRNGYRLHEVGVRHFPRQFGEQSGANLHVILRMFKESWKLRNELRGE